MVAEPQSQLCHGVLDLSGLEGLQAVVTQSQFFARVRPWISSPLSDSFITATPSGVSWGA